LIHHVLPSTNISGEYYADVIDEFARALVHKLTDIRIMGVFLLKTLLRFIFVIRLKIDLTLIVLIQFDIHYARLIWHLPTVIAALI